MLTTRYALSILFAGLAILGASALYGQDYPNKPIRIVTGGVGGNTDVVTRLIAQGLTASSGWSIVVDNRPTGVIPGDTVAKASPDGYTLLVSGSLLWLLPFMRDYVPFDPVRDFSPVSLTSLATNILVVHPSMKVQSVKELIALAKARPGELNYSSTGIGSSSHLAGELFKAMADVKIVHIPYNSGSTLMANLLGGHVQLAFATADSVAPHIKSGRLKALAVTSARPSLLFPDLPTVASSGLPGYESGTITGLFAPAKTPLTIISKLNQETVRALNQADIKEKFLHAGIEVVGSSPEAFATAMKTDIARLGKILKDTGIKAD